MSGAYSTHNKGFDMKICREQTSCTEVGTVRVKIKFNLEQDMNGQTGKRGIALLFL
jgi:riboflavin synthase alpha subunit